MAELVVIGAEAADQYSDDPGVSVRLYCWPCRTVHEFKADDVEWIVYALGALEVHAYQVASEDPELGGDLGRAGPTCLEEVLRVAGDSDMAAEHVEQGVQCRQAHDA